MQNFVIQGYVRVSLDLFENQTIYIIPILSDRIMCVLGYSGNTVPVPQFRIHQGHADTIPHPPTPRLTELTCCNNLKVIWICHKVRSVIGRWTHSKDICTGERIDYVSTKLNIQSSAYSTVLEVCALNFGLVGRFDYSLQILEGFC